MALSIMPRKRTPSDGEGGVMPEGREGNTFDTRLYWEAKGRIDALKRELETSSLTNARMSREIATLEAELAEARADSERLDWLDENANPCIHCPSDDGTFDLKWAHATNYRIKDLRAAIDQARGKA
jgi:hypothetical protein